MNVGEGAAFGIDVEEAGDGEPKAGKRGPERQAGAAFGEAPPMGLDRPG